MGRNLYIAVVVGSLLCAGCTGRAGRSRATVYPKSRVLQCSCSAAWPDLLGTVADAGFRLVAKDDAGHIARFLYLEPQLPGIVRTGGDPDALALDRDGSGQQSAKLRIESAVLALSQLDHGCEVKISVSYQGQSGIWGRNWSSLESSGLLENRVLSELRVNGRTKVEQRQVMAQRRAARNVAGSARFAASSQVSIIGGANAPPQAEYTPDSAYDGVRQ